MEGAIGGRRPRSLREKCPLLLALARALNRQQAELGPHAAARREASRLAVGAHDAMTRDDDGEAIAPEGAAHAPGGARAAEPGRDRAIRARPARGDGACDVLDAAV